MSSPGLQKKDLVNECRTFTQVSGRRVAEGSLVRSQQCTWCHTTQLLEARSSGLHIVRDARASGPDSSAGITFEFAGEVQEDHMSGHTLLHLLSHIAILGVDMH